MRRLVRQLVVLAFGLGLLVLPGRVFAQAPAQQLAALAPHLDTAIGRLEAGDVAGARAAYQAFDDGWFEIEDGIRAQSKASYRAIESAMGDAKLALRAEPPDPARARAALQALRAQCDTFIGGAPPTGGNPPAGGPVTLPGLVDHLDRAQARLDAGDPAGAAAEVDAFRRDWPEVEGEVKVRSARTYTETENKLAKAWAQLTRRPPDAGGGRATLAQLQADLAPLAAGQASYGVFDAAIILLREGLEVLLVVGALLAFLAKTGHADKGRWIWAGGGAGVAASIAVAFAVNIAFAQAAAGTNRELLEGLTGLVAAAMLVYMSYWLHSKAQLGAWHAYIRDKSTTALAGNSLLSLALIAFLAVFREGAETVLFYVGISSSIALRDLVVGLAIGTAGLAALGVAMLVFGLRIPIRPFFLGTSVLIYYLAFKFVGTGLHALQVAGLLSATPGDPLPENGFLGLFPTWETSAVQAVLLLAAAAVVLLQRLRRPAPVDRSGHAVPA